MTRWSTAAKDSIETPDIDAFLTEVIAVCHKHGMSIRYEDEHGAFEITEFNIGDANWLLDAHDGRVSAHGGLTR